jgi:hypothetical protein
MPFLSLFPPPITADKEEHCFQRSCTGSTHNNPSQSTSPCASAFRLRAFQSQDRVRVFTSSSGFEHTVVKLSGNAPGWMRISDDNCCLVLANVVVWLDPPILFPNIGSPLHNDILDASSRMEGLGEHSHSLTSCPSERLQLLASVRAAPIQLATCSATVGDAAQDPTY